MASGIGQFTSPVFPVTFKQLSVAPLLSILLASFAPLCAFFIYSVFICIHSPLPAVPAVTVVDDETGFGIVTPLRCFQYG